MIKVQGLRKSFHGQPVLRGTDLEVPDGSITVIIGRSGGGKSVFLKHLLGLLRADSGRIEVGGVDLTHLSGRALDEVRKYTGREAAKAGKARRSATTSRPKKRPKGKGKPRNSGRR